MGIEFDKEEKINLYFPNPVIDQASVCGTLRGSVLEVIECLKKDVEDNYLMCTYRIRPEDVPRKLLRKKIEYKDNIKKFLEGLWGSGHSGDL